MPVPKKKTSKSRRDKRRTHDSLKPPSTSTCPSCYEVKPPHQACPHCGVYKNREVLEIKEI